MTQHSWKSPSTLDFIEQENAELCRRLESVLPPAALLPNEKVAQTLQVFQKTCGLVVQDESASPAALIAGALNELR